MFYQLEISVNKLPDACPRNRVSIPRRDRFFFFFFSKMLRPALGSIQPFILCLPAAILPRVKRPIKLTAHFCLVPNLRMHGATP